MMCKCLARWAASFRAQGQFEEWLSQRGPEPANVRCDFPRNGSNKARWKLRVSDKQKTQDLIKKNVALILNSFSFSCRDRLIAKGNKVVRYAYIFLEKLYRFVFEGCSSGGGLQIEETWGGVSDGGSRGRGTQADVAYLTFLRCCQHCMLSNYLPVGKKKQQATLC